MRWPLILLVLLLTMGATIIVIAWGAEPANATGLDHPDQTVMRVGGPGIERHSQLSNPQRIDPDIEAIMDL